MLVAGLGISPIIATLATGSMLEGIALVFSHGAPIGNAPPVLLWFLNSRLGGLPPAVWFLAIFVLIATLVLNGSGFGRRVRAIGNSQWVARLSGVHVPAVTVAVYILSSLCSAIVGLMLAGFSDQAYYDMGKPYLLASIAVVVLGGTRITGGRSHYIGILGGALLFTAMGSMLQTTSLPEAVRSIIYGGVLLLAVILLRDKRSNEFPKTRRTRSRIRRNGWLRRRTYRFASIRTSTRSRCGSARSAARIRRATSRAACSRAKRGVPRLIDFFKRYGIITTWGVTGHSMESFPRAAEMIIEAGHEIGIHGYTHENPLAMSREQEAEVLDRTFEVIKTMSGKAPIGYMAPWWELSPNTVELLLARGMKYDSSMMEDDYHPYYLRVGDSWTKID